MLQSLIPAKKSREAGNIIFYVLLGIVLIGLLTMALRKTNEQSKDLDQEQIFIKSTQIQKYAAQVAQAVAYLQEKGVSETDMRFAHPKASGDYGTITTNPQNQVFHPTGGNADYQLPPTGLNDGSKWEFYGTTDIPQIGSDKSDLIMVLPNITQEACQIINRQLGFDINTQPEDVASGANPDCVYSTTAADRFTGAFDSTPNVLDDTTFSRLPVTQACVLCASDGTYNYFYVLNSR